MANSADRYAEQRKIPSAAFFADITGPRDLRLEEKLSSPFENVQNLELFKRVNNWTEVILPLESSKWHDVVLLMQL